MMNSFLKYFTDILDNKIVACDKIKKISELLLNDYYTPNEWHFDEETAARHINFIEKFCKQPSGELGKPLKLQLFQKARLEAVFGFVNDNGIRKYNEVLIVEGRKNGKTTESAAVELDLLLNDKEGAPQIYNVATMLDQAKLGFNAALKMRNQSPLLKKHIKKRASDLYAAYNMGFIKALASNSNSLDGLDSHGAIIDELGAIKNRDIYDLVKQSMGARRQPLLFCISTNGYIRESIFDAQYTYAANVLNGTINNPRFLPFIYELDNADEFDNPDMWVKANPGLGTIKKREYLAEMVKKAKDDPSFKPTVLVKDFNIPQTGATTWLPFEYIVNEKIVDIDYLKNSYAIGACDLSATTDLTASTLLIKKPNDANVYILQQYFLPEARVSEIDKTQKKEAPYRLWAEQGHLTICEGAQVNYSDVTKWFISQVKNNNIRPLWVCYDRALAGYWAEEMSNAGFDMVKIPQGAYTWSQPMKEMGAAFREHKVIYNNNPILRWCLSNTGCKSLNRDGIETIQPVKLQQGRRIDGMVSLLNAWVGYVKFYNEYTRFIK